MITTWNVATSQDTNTKSLGVIGEIAYLPAPLGSDHVTTATDEVSIAVTVIADAGANTGAVAACLDAAINAG